MDIDATDRALIALLRANARESVAALAQTLKLSRGTVQKRIDRMTASGVIQGFTVRTVPDAEGERVRAVMTIAIEGERSGAVLRALRGFPEVAAVHTTNGRWDLVAELSTEGLAAFSRTLDAIRMIDGIASTETSLLLATHKM
ncbi:Lrp/AsnC family transcriptional regulator [Phenylobacterium sp.]|jgi:DNA-binding Lrp family transcriptional regulator|uniref:Lrp/AsnC family transcriptional regulator n=1 Tax=Phenylobacterium sp. TaxID=1871053 RepID=UPI002F426CBF